MYCPDCKKDYNKEEQAWRFIGIGVAFEGLYILESDEEEYESSTLRYLATNSLNLS